jgi:PAS domain S-box-containing protein
MWEESVSDKDESGDRLSGEEPCSALSNNADDALEAIRAPAERRWDIFENAPVGIFQSTPEGVMLRSNPAFAHMCGYESPSELVHYMRDIAHQLYVREADRQCFLEELFRSPSWISSEMDFRHRSGGLIHANVCARAVRDKCGKVEYIEGFIEDSTERKVAEKALRESERIYRTIFEDSMDAIYITDRFGNFIDANKATLDLFGYSRDEILNLSARRLYADEYERERLGKELKEKGRLRDYELRLQRADGSKMDCIVSVTKWKEHDGKTLGYLGIVRDISARKQAETALKESKARYYAIVEDQTELICRFLPDGRFTFVNDAFCRYFKRSREELLGESCIPLIAEEERERVKEAIKTLSVTNPVATFEHRVMLPDGEVRWQQWSDRAIFDDRGDIVEFQSVGRDITERKQFEEALRQANEELERRVEKRTAELRNKANDLEELNTTLKVLLNQREADRVELEESVLSNVKSLILPYIGRLKRSRLDSAQITNLIILESHIDGITSPFLKKLSDKYIGLTPAEIEVADLIKDGKTTKEIADILHISENTVLTHRYHLRTKLGLKNKRVNLRSYLKSLHQ